MASLASNLETVILVLFQVRVEKKALNLLSEGMIGVQVEILAFLLLCACYMGVIPSPVLLLGKDGSGG